MRKTFALIVAVGLMAALLALPGTALGRAAFTEYTATEIQTGGPDFDPATDWTKPIVQARFQSVFVDTATDPRASGTTYVSGKITFTDLATFTGIMSGTSLTEVSGEGYEGTWVGHWQGKLTGFGGSFYKAVAHGTGDLAGMKMMMTYDSTRDPVIMGRLLDPHGG
jgi:hypothetical protein